MARRMICSGCHEEVREEDIAQIDGKLLHVVQEADHDGPGSDPASWYVYNTTCGEVTEEEQDSVE